MDIPAALDGRRVRGVVRNGLVSLAAVWKAMRLLGASILSSMKPKTIGVHVFMIALKTSQVMMLKTSQMMANVGGFLMQLARLSLNIGVRSSKVAQQLTMIHHGVLFQIRTMALGHIAATNVQVTAMRLTRSMRRSRRIIPYAPGSRGQSVPSLSFTKEQCIRDVLTLITLLLGAPSTKSTTGAGLFANVSAPKRYQKSLHQHLRQCPCQCRYQTLCQCQCQCLTLCRCQSQHRHHRQQRV